MTSDSVPPVLSKVEIYSNNDNDIKIAKLGDVVTFRVTSIEDVYKPTVLINSNTISSDKIYYSSGLEQNEFETIYTYLHQTI